MIGTRQGRGVELRPRAPGAGWTVTSVPGDGSNVAACDRSALGTSVRLVLWPPEGTDGACAAVDRVLDDLDQQVSRFRPDSELARAERNAGLPTILTQGAADALTVALAAAAVSGGRVDPTVGAALCDLGYDRDFAAMDPSRARRPARPAPGWRAVRLDGRVLRLTLGVRLDLGATAKGLGADRAASAALRALGGCGGVLVNLGGDLAAAGTPPRRGWPVGVSEDPSARRGATSQVVRVVRGGVATSSVLHRRWRNAGSTLHHIVDPATGHPVSGLWRTATVAARTCAEANTASTTAIVAGADAEAWLASHALPARLVDREGRVHAVGGWPRRADEPVPIPSRSIFESRTAMVRQ
jgi:thiamine biosynthesis lipoprotein